jgi:uncharacterized membrane protein YkgB
MLRVTFFAIPNQMEIKRTEVHYFVRKPRWENNEFTRSIAASSGHSKAEIDSRRCTLVSTASVHISRYALVLILFWIGIQKFTLAEAEGIRVFTMHSPFVSWMYSFLSVRAASSLIGTVEVSLAVLIALRPVSPRVSFLGSVGAIMTFLTTVSFLFTTPGVIDHSHAVPLLGELGGFLLKDLALLGCAVLTAAEARGAYSLGGDRF